VQAITTPPPTRTSRRLFYGWYIALAGALSNFLSAGIAVWGFGIFIQPLKDEMGWSTAAIALGFSIRSFEQGLLAPLTGVLVDRMGPRKMAISGTVILVAGILIFSQARTLWMYYTASVVMAVGQSVGSFLPYSAVLMRWFERKRGRAMGILNAGNGSGYFVVPALAFLIGAVGWRETLVVGAVAVAVVSLPLAATIVRDYPSDKNEYPDGIPVPAPRLAADGSAPVLPGMTVAEAIRTPTFYLLALAAAGNGAAIVGWLVHQIPHLEDVGFSIGWATTIGVIYAVCQVTIRPIAGVLGDRLGRKRLFAASFALQSVGMVIFALLSSDRVWLLPFYYLTFAFGQAAWVVLQQAVVADYFGPRRFGTISGLVNAVQMPVGVASPVVAGLVFDRTGTYVPIFLAYSVGSLIAAAAIMLIRRPTLSAEANATLSTAGAH